MKREQVSALQHLFYGHGNVPAKKDFECAWKAVKAVAAGRKRLSAPKLQCLLGRMSAAGTPPEVVDHVMAWDERSERPAALLAHLSGPAEGRLLTGAWILYEGLSVALVDGELGAGELAAVRAMAKGMDLAPETVDALSQVCSDEAAIRRRRIDLLFSGGAPSLHFDQL